MTWTLTFLPFTAPRREPWWRFGYRGPAGEGAGRVLWIPTPWGVLRVHRFASVIVGATA